MKSRKTGKEFVFKNSHVFFKEKEITFVRATCSDIFRIFSIKRKKEIKTILFVFHGIRQ